MSSLLMGRSVDTNVPVFIFSLVFLFTAILSIFGFLALSLSSWTLIRVFHTMYLFTATLTFAMMLGWLGVNQSQTGAWDRIMLDNDPRSVPASSTSSFLASSPPAPFASTAEDVKAIWFKSILNMDPTTRTWIISLWQWILAFTTIFVCQCACWYYGLLAYDRQVQDRKLRGKESF
ncbi:MAG: hypothetical protein J3R72DRAFT_157713 [Linnemannia gamsii]|nr:MAG: hypothetical protein J3R72DRAFT_157713 [Linnemannia gamsii]